MIDDLQQTKKELSSQEYSNLSKSTKSRLLSLERKPLAFGIPIHVLLLIGSYIFFGNPSSTPDIDHSIAVLPLENLSSDPEDDFFADGVHEEIISSLSGIGALMVIARSSVRDYSPEERNLNQISRELGVSTLMEGAVRRSGDRIRVSVSLIAAEDQAMIWSNTYEDHVQDVFGLQSRIAREITDALQTTLTANEQQRLEQQPTDNPQAYLFYIQGRDYLSRSRYLVENPLSKHLGSEYGFTRFTIDGRRYFSLYHSHVLAVQAVGMFTAGSVPFRMLPSVGNVFRGYSSVRYIDRNLIALQAEYRVVPLTWRVGFTALAGISEVFSQLNEVSHENLKYVVGFGVRFQFSRSEKINIKADYGIGHRSSGDYIDINEAF